MDLVAERERGSSSHREVTVDRDSEERVAHHSIVTNKTCKKMKIQLKGVMGFVNRCHGVF